MTIRTLLCCSLAAFSIWLAGCHKHDAPPPPALATDSTSISLGAAANSKDSFNVMANIAWTLSGLPQWATASATSGSGNQKILISTRQNNATTSPLTATLTIAPASGTTPASRTVTIIQAAALPSLTTDSSALTLGAAQSSKDSFMVVSNAAWTLSGLPQWATASAMSGTGNQKIYITTSSANTGSAALTGSLTVSASGLPNKVISLTQKAAALSITSFSPLHAAGGATITITGQGFSTTATDNIVTINGKAATVTAATSTSLTVTVPMSAGDGQVKVSLGSQNATGSATFIYDITYHVSTIAGSAGQYGLADGTGNSARFNGPVGLTTDAQGDIYVAEYGNNTIRKITPAGVVTTIAGTGLRGSADGTGTNAWFYTPTGVTIDAQGNLYVADRDNAIIRKITPAGVVTTFAGSAGQTGSVDGTGNSARFNGPYAVAVDAQGNIYVADSGNNTIRKITPAGVVTTIAGSAGQYGSADGTGTGARFSTPSGITVDAQGNIYVSDGGNATIRKITSAGVVTTFAGSAGQTGSADGTGNGAQFAAPNGLTVDAQGNIYVADYLNYTIRKITPAGVVTTIAGSVGQIGYSDGTGGGARFHAPIGVTVDAQGNIYVADDGNNTIRKITLQ